MPDSHRTFITLKEGCNLLLAKIRRGKGWEFYLRVADIFGNRIEGIRPVFAKE